MPSLSASGGTRLSDDLYSLYLAGVAWLVIPMYATVVAQILPSDLGGFNQAVDVAAAGALGASAWFGYRGGPFLVNRAVVLHELGSPLARRQVLLPRLARQAVAYAALAALAANALSAMGEPDSFGYPLAARNSFVAGVAGFAAVLLTAGWLVFWKGGANGPGSLRTGLRRLSGAVSLVAAAVVTAVVASGRSLSEPVGVTALVTALVLSVGVAVVALEGVPVEHLWRRATALEGMRSAALSFDFQRVLVSLRRAVDQTEARRSPMALARPWMPTALWRYLAGFERGWNTRLSQLVLGTGAAFLATRADPANGVIALAVSGAGLVVGLELASPVASTAGQTWFGVHYPKGSVPILRAEILTAAAIAVGLATVSLTWLIGPRGLTSALAVAGLFVFGTLAAAVQGRLGSPDLAWLSEHMATILGPILWIRALLGPLLCLALTIVVSRGWLRPDDLGNWAIPAAAIVAAAIVVAGYPLERTLP